MVIMKRRDFLKSSVVLGLGYTFLPLIPTAFSSDATYQEYYNLGDDFANLETIFETIGINFGREEDSKFLIDGWSHTGEGHTWSVGKEATLVFYTFSPLVTKTVTIRCQPFTKLPEQSMKVFLNNHLLKEISLKKKRNIYEFNLPAEHQKNFLNHIRFVFQNLGAPKEYGMSGDGRKLAVDFNWLTIRTKEYQEIQSNLGQLAISKRDKEKNILMPINSMVSKRILIKPGTVLEIDIGGLAEAQDVLFKTMVDYGGKSDIILSLPFKKRQSKEGSNATLDLAKYSNRIVKLSFVYESSAVRRKKPPCILKLRAALKQPVKKNEVLFPNILLIAVDTLRADHLSCYGSKLNTPNIDKLAKEGVLFEYAYSHIPLTLPSFTCIFTSLYPSETLVLNNGQAVSEDKLTLAELLTSCGFETAAIVSLFSLDKNTHIDQGFQSYSDYSKGIAYFRNAKEVNEEMLHTINRLAKGGNWFQFLHYSDPHGPYHGHELRSTPVDICLNGKTIAQIDIANQNTGMIDISLDPGENTVQLNASRMFSIEKFTLDPKGIRLQPKSGIVKTKIAGKWSCHKKGSIEIYNSTPKARPVKLSFYMSESLNLGEIGESYQEEVRYVDKKIGEMLSIFEKKGLLDDTVIIFTSDHGEGIGDHNLIGHAEQLYDSLIRIPLIISYPNVLPKALRIPKRVRHIDILPTILEILGVSAGNSFKGQSLLPLLKEMDQTDRPVLSMTFKGDAERNLVSLIENGYKIIKNLDSNDLELYNIKDDPKELKDISKINIFKLNRMERKLNMLMEKEGYSSQFDSTKGNSIKLDKDQIDKLRGLGYMK